MKDESVLPKLYPGRVIIPKLVYDELSRVPHLKARIDILLDRGEVSIMESGRNGRTLIVYGIYM